MERQSNVGAAQKKVQETRFDMIGGKQVRIKFPGVGNPVIVSLVDISDKIVNGFGINIPPEFSDTDGILDPGAFPKSRRQHLFDVINDLGIQTVYGPGAIGMGYLTRTLEELFECLETDPLSREYNEIRENRVIDMLVNLNHSKGKKGEGDRLFDLLQALAEGLSYAYAGEDLFRISDLIQPPQTPREHDVGYSLKGLELIQKELGLSVDLPAMVQECFDRYSKGDVQENELIGMIANLVEAVGEKGQDINKIMWALRKVRPQLSDYFKKRYWAK